MAASADTIGTPASPAHVELTHKGQLYALRKEPGACPKGIDPAQWRKAVSLRINQHLAIVSALVAALDGFEVDADLEATGDELDASWPEGRAHLGFTLDTEDDEQDEEGDPLDDSEADELENGELDWSEYDGQLVPVGGAYHV